MDPNLPEPSCQAGLTRYSTGKDRILLTRPSSAASRTWPVSKAIQYAKAAYADLAVAHDGSILSVYESGGSASLADG